MSKLTAARKELWKVQKNAAEIRNDYLEEMACLQNSSHNTDIAMIIKTYATERRKNLHSDQ
eukprot:12560159-Ditylum_brightwellii.AAC.1